jgi:2-dehydropantoate 2-reductase
VCAQPVAVGPLAFDPARTPQAQKIARLLEQAHVPCIAVASVQALLWEKVLYNCGLNPLGALHGLTYGEVVASPELRPMLDSAIGEGFEVARALGVGLRWSDAEAFREYFHTVLLPPTAAHRSSMRQDLEAGRLTEVEAISGAIVRAGERCRVPTPVNARLLAAIHAAEQSALARTKPRDR